MSDQDQDDFDLQRDKRKRQPNFTMREKLELFSIIKDTYAHVLENKATDKISVEMKENSWRSIEKDFNSVSSTGIFRDSLCLKRLYENRKREVKKAVAKNKQEQRKTGGGPELKIDIDVADDILLQLMNTKTVKGSFSLFDSDADLVETPINKGQKTAEEQYFLKRSNILKNTLENTDQANDDYENDQDGQSSSSFEVVEVNSLDDFERAAGFKTSDLQMCKDSSFMSTPSSSYLPCKISDKENLQSTKHPFNMANDLKKRKDPALTLPYLQKNKEEEAFKEQQKKEETNSALVNKADLNRKEKRGQEKRRMLAQTRRQGVQILASSHIAKKYDQLLDQRKVLLEKQIEIANQELIFQKRKQQLEIELLTVKVAKEKNN